MKFFISILSVFAVSNCLAQSISYTHLSDSEYEFLLESDQSLSIEDAQASIHESSVIVCKEQTPVFGKYSFDSFEAVEKKPENKNEFRFKQIVKCAGNTEAKAQRSVVPLITNSNDEKALKLRIESLTRQYLDLKSQGELKKAYAYLTDTMKSLSSESDWIAREESYSLPLGAIQSSDIWRITIYDNPPNSPRTGIYIAADYENVFKKAPIQCGYVIWYVESIESNDYQVMREEFGHISDEMFEKIPLEQIPNVRKQLGCKPIMR